jgi:hypothetical protein
VNDAQGLAVTRTELLAFMRNERFVAQASVSRDRAVQAAVVGIAVSDDFEIVFDTLRDSRKAANLRANPSVAFVIGGTRDGDERTVQYEGAADTPSGDELRRVWEIYFGVFPDGRDRLHWPGLIHVRVKPLWIRYGNYGVQPPLRPRVRRVSAARAVSPRPPDASVSQLPSPESFGECLGQDRNRGDQRFPDAAQETDASIVLAIPGIEQRDQRPGVHDDAHRRCFCARRVRMVDFASVDGAAA